MSVDLLRLQLSELEMLQGMFGGDGELRVDSESVLTDVERYVAGGRSAPPRPVGLTVTHRLGHDDQQMTIESRCNLPLEYPDVLPKVYVSCNSASRLQQKDFNEKLDDFVSGQPLGELCLSSILLWIQENAPNFITAVSEDDQKSPTKRQKSKHSCLSRLWIYSHHVYRKELLKKIPECAKELDLTGFCLPGKPGIICVEGFSDFCDEYWRKLRYPNWKHISCKHREDKQIDGEEEVEQALKTFRIFSSFEELAFEAHGDYGLRNDYHMDLGQFRVYLEKHGCQQIFTILFGLDGKNGNA